MSDDAALYGRCIFEETNDGSYVSIAGLCRTAAMLHGVYQYSCRILARNTREKVARCDISPGTLRARFLPFPLASF